MIQIYSLTNKDFSKNGDTILLPDSAIVSAELNGVWSLELHHPIDNEDRWKAIVENAVVKAPSFNGEQLFRIYSVEKEDNGVTTQAFPIFLDAKEDCFLADIRPTNKNGQLALNDMCAPNKKYSGKSDITATNTAYYEYVNLIEAINGDLEQSFINRWGGEILYDNYQIIINQHVGGDYGVEVLYGKNLARNGMKEHVVTSDVVTRIYPKSYNGHKLSGVGYVDSTRIGKYPVVHQRVMQFEDVKLVEDCNEDDYENGTIVCKDQKELDTALRKKCEDTFTTGIDLPKVHIDCDMVLLQDTEEYKDLKILETVALGDTIHCRHSKLGIVTDARVISLEYDCMRNRVEKVELGDFENKYIDKVSSIVDRVEGAITPSGGVVAEKVQGILDAMKTQLKLQQTAGKKLDVKAVIFEDLDKASPLYGCMALGTQGLQIAKERTTDGRDWNWKTAATANGIVADAIMTGLLSDKVGKNYWNLDTGDMRLSSDKFLIDDKTLNDFFEIEEQKKKNFNLLAEKKCIAVGTPKSMEVVGSMPTVEINVFPMLNDTVIKMSDVEARIYNINVTGARLVKGEKNFIVRFGGFGFGKNEDEAIIKAQYNGLEAETTVKIVRQPVEADGERSPQYSVTSSPRNVKFDAEGNFKSASLELTPLTSDVTVSTKPEKLYLDNTSYKVEAIKKDGTKELLGTVDSRDHGTGYFLLGEYADIIRKSAKLLVTCTFKKNGATATVEVPVYHELKNYKHDDIFNALTNYGAIKGIYKQGNQLYVSFDYAQGGTLTLGGKYNGRGRLSLLDANNSEFGTIDRSGYVIRDTATGDETRIVPGGIIRQTGGVDRPYHYFTKIGKIVHTKEDFTGGGYQETYCQSYIDIPVKDLPNGFRLTLENIYMQIVSIQSGIVLSDDYNNQIQALANNAIVIDSVAKSGDAYRVRYTCTCTYFLPKRNNFKDRFISPESLTIQYMIIG